MKFTKTVLFLLLFCAGQQVFGQLRLPSLFSDQMVLQQQSEVSIWGWAAETSPVKIVTGWDDETYVLKSDKEGKWQAKIATPNAGGPFQLIIESGETITLEDVMIGEVWVCAGQSNMEMPLRGFRGEPVANANDEIIRSTNPSIRMISVPRKSTTEPQVNFEGTWKKSAPGTSGDFSATAYYFAKLLNELTGVSIGLIDISYGGSNIEAWMSAKTLSAYPDINIPDNDTAIGEPNRTPTVLYNGMLHPVIRYTMKGVIWYQGESNAQAPLQYEALFPDMVSQWRTEWGQGVFPFYYAQIAPFDYDLFYPEPKPWFANSAHLRDAQRKAQYTIPNSGMATLLDAGDMSTIHPMDKQTPGERLAWLALAKTYRFEGFGYDTPDYDELNIEDSLVTVTFKNLPNGLTAYGKEVTAFEIAGKDQVFFPAKCIVRRKSVQIYSEMVKKPVAVRYAFTNAGPAQLFSTEGIPVSSFRTDAWDPKTEVKTKTK